MSNRDQHGVGVDAAVRLLRVLVNIAHADGHLAPAERALFGECVQDLPLSEARREELMLELDNPRPLPELCAEVTTAAEREHIMTTALRMALSDGHYCEREQALIGTLAELLYQKDGSQAKPAAQNAEVSAPGSTKPLARASKTLSVSGVHTAVDVRIVEKPIPGPTLFDVHSEPGELHVFINSRHPAAQLLVHSEARDGLQYLLMSWATMEQASGDAGRQAMEDMRHDWGRVLRDMLTEMVERDGGAA